jgi:hypothetical protein
MAALGILVASCSHGSSSVPTKDSSAIAPLPSVVAQDPALPTSPLPTSSATAPVPGDALVVTLATGGLSLGRQGPSLAVLDADRSTWSQGFEAKYKQSSRNDMRLLPLEAALAEHRAGDAAPPEALVAADGTIAYRMLFEVLYTLGQSGVSRLALEVRSPSGHHALALAPGARAPAASSDGAGQLLALMYADGRHRDAGVHAHASPSQAAPAPALDASAPLQAAVAFLAEGFAVSGARAKLGPGCDGPGASPAVPKKGADYDYAGLGACLAKLKASAPRFASETTVTLVPMAGTDVQTLVSVIDAVRGPDGSIFADVQLGVPR